MYDTEGGSYVEERDEADKQIKLLKAEVAALASANKALNERCDALDESLTWHKFAAQGLTTERDGYKATDTQLRAQRDELVGALKECADALWSEFATSNGVCGAGKEPYELAVIALAKVDGGKVDDENT